MAMNVDLKSALALVVSEARERQTYTGTGDARVVSGRLVDVAGRPLSGCSALVLTDAFGLASDAAVLVPDSQIAALIPGSVVRLDGELHARLVGGDYGSIRTTVTAERVTPLGDAAQILRGLAEKAPKPVETRPAA
ncbi:MAG TPA: hypothetical protein VIM10_14755 [Actinopolymorphaceae bacterium]